MVPDSYHSNFIHSAFLSISSTNSYPTKTPLIFDFILFFTKTLYPDFWFTSSRLFFTLSPLIIYFAFSSLFLEVTSHFLNITPQWVPAFLVQSIKHVLHNLM